MEGGERAQFGRRLRFLGLLLLVGLAAVAVRLSYVQLGQHERFAGLARDSYLRRVKVPARRGAIYDRKGRALAVSVSVPSVFAHPAEIIDPRPAAAKLAPLLQLSQTRVMRQLAADRLFVWLKRHVSPETAEAVRELKLRSVGITYEPKRFYPNREVASHLLGFAGMDARGLEGLELAFEDVLQGESQTAAAIRDARGRAVLRGELDPQERAAGADLRLTVDLHIQHAAEVALQRAVERTQARSAMAVVLDAKTAGVLALAMVPRFNPNAPGRAAASVRRNRAVTDMFEPGSTMKPLVMAAALEAGVLGPRQKVDGEGGKLKVGRHTIRDRKPYGRLTQQEILAVSANVPAAKIGLELGAKRLEQALRSYGFGAKTALPLPGETAGRLRPAKRWSKVGTANIAFGHGVAVSTVQLAAAYGVLAHDGVWRPLRLLASGVGSGSDAGSDAVARLADGAPALPPSRRVVSVKVARRLREMLTAVVEPGGTGVLAAIAGYRVAGKTGTAQKVDAEAGGYSDERFVAAFAGMAPAAAPRVVAAVVVDEPQEPHTGGAVAAPAFAEMVAVALRELGVPATESLADGTAPTARLQVR